MTLLVSVSLHNKSLRSLNPDILRQHASQWYCVRDQSLLFLLLFSIQAYLIFYCFLSIFKNSPFPPTKLDSVGLFLIDVLFCGCGNTRGLPILGDRGITGLLDF